MIVEPLDFVAPSIATEGENTSAEEWDARFYKLAEQAASWSKDPIRRVGSVVVTPDCRSFSLGYNGFPRGYPDAKELLMDEELRQMLMVHGEINAILNSPFDVAGSTLYATKFPCHKCAGVIANARISRIVSPPGNLDHPKWGTSYKLAHDIFRWAGLEVKGLGIIAPGGE